MVHASTQLRHADGTKNVDLMSVAVLLLHKVAQQTDHASPADFADVQDPTSGTMRGAAHGANPPVIRARRRKPQPSRGENPASSDERSEM